MDNKDLKIQELEKLVKDLTDYNSELQERLLAVHAIFKDYYNIMEEK